MAAHPLRRPRRCSSVGLVNAREIEHAATGAVAVAPSLVFQAKAYLVAHASGYTKQMVDGFVAEMGSTLIQPVISVPKGLPGWPRALAITMMTPFPRQLRTSDRSPHAYSRPPR